MNKPKFMIAAFVGTGFVAAYAIAFFINLDSVRYTDDILNGVRILNRSGFSRSVPFPEGWNSIDGEAFYFRDGKHVTGFQEIEGQIYHFDDDGVLSNGWYSIDENVFYFLKDGTPAVGQFEIEGEVYFFSEDGILTETDKAVTEAG